MSIPVSKVSKSDKFLRPDGVVEWRPDEAITARAAAAGAPVIGQGRLCTACLVGDWPMTSLRMSQTLCDACRALEAEVARRAGLGGGSTRARVTVEQARAYRAARLAGVFVRARALGVVQLEESRRPGRPPYELVAYDDLRRHDLIPGTMADRVRRYSDWARQLDPVSFAERAQVLADVDALARWLRRHVRDSARAHARHELDQAVRDAARAPGNLARGLAAIVGARRREL